MPIVCTVFPVFIPASIGSIDPAISRRAAGLTYGPFLFSRHFLICP